VSPISRTNSFYTNPARFPFPEATEERAAELLKQQKFDPIALQFYGRKSWHIEENI
jgi:hypothetical protein